MAVFDAWGGSWGTSWGLSWTGEHAQPEPEPTPTPPPSGGVGGGGYSSAWRRHLQDRLRREARRDQEKFARSVETLKRPDDRAAAKRAADLAAKAIDQATRAIDPLENIDFAERLAKALGIAAEAKRPKQVIARAKEVEAASIALMEMLAAALATPPPYEMTDDDVAAILLLA